jgi:hypothetical protein
MDFLDPGRFFHGFGEGGVTFSFINSYQFLALLLPSSENFSAVAVVAGYVFEAGFNELAGLLDVVGYSGVEAVFRHVLEKLLVQGNVHQRIVDFFVAEGFFDVQDVFGFVVLHSCLPVP